MRNITSIKQLEDFGRVQLSRTFFMREFLYSEISNFHGIPNIPDNPELAIEVGKKLCEELLEPLNDTFGRVAIRSSYRSCTINEYGNQHGNNCAKNEANYARHIWDRLDEDGLKGATACIVLPWFTNRFAQGADWRGLAYWIHDHLPYSELQFFPNLCAFNLSWHEKPIKSIYSFIAPKGYLLKECHVPSQQSALYADFPTLVINK